MATPPTGQHDVFREAAARGSLDALFEPRHIAVIGATDKPGSVGRATITNLLGSPFGGTVYPVNPNRKSVLGVPAWACVGDLPEAVDLAIIVIRADLVPQALRECAAAGVKAAVILTAGFREVGEKGAALEKAVAEEARRGGVRVLGPNCIGLMNPRTGLNATFARTMALPGKVGFISQSGALCTAILDWSRTANVGFSAFVSIGSMVDIGWSDLLYRLADDRHTKSILLYMESMNDHRAFLSAAREVSYTKPIIVLKAGRTEAGARAAGAHVGALVEDDAVLDAAFRRCGVLRVRSIQELFNMADILDKQPRPRGPRLTILTNAGGPAVLATDVLVATGGTPTELSESTQRQLNELLPPHWSRGNPIDVLGDATPEEYGKAAAIALAETGGDALLAVLTTQAMTDPLKTAEQFAAAVKGKTDKPVLASWMGGAEIAPAAAILDRAGIPNLPFPDQAARVFTYMWQYTRNLDGIYETPALPAMDDADAPDRDLAHAIIDAARREGRTALSEHESKQLLRAYRIPTADTRIARTEEEAVAAANAIGYPVAIKVHSYTLSQKTRVGGVELGVTSDDGAVRAYRRIMEAVARKAGAEHVQGVVVQPMAPFGGFKLALGSHTDPHFGPVLYFGTGGHMLETIQDLALALPPLNSTLATRLMEQTRIHATMSRKDEAGAIDLNALAGVLARFSHLVSEQRWINSIDLNPLLISEDGLMALDARMLLHSLDTPIEAVPELAIRPYPAHYETEWTTKQGLSVAIRPIRPEDEQLMVKFHETLSPESVYFRYFHIMGLEHRVDHRVLVRSCFIDYNREMTLIALHTDPSALETSIMGVVRLIRLHGSDEAEFAVAVSDAFHGQGLGSMLLRKVLDVAKAEGIPCVVGNILPENRTMIEVCKRVGFEVEYSVEDQLIHARYPVQPH